MALSVYRFIANGWIERFFVEPAFHFKYWGFAWVQPLPGGTLRLLCYALIALASCMAAGLCFRAAALLFALGFTYLQLIDVSTYLNHYYLAALLAFLLAASPAGHAASLDAWLVPALRRDTAPRCWQLLFRFQVGVVYVFAGLAKAESDWLLHAQPLSIWLGASTGLPLLGRLLTLPFVPLALSWCGFLFDTTVVGFLLWSRSRPFAYAAVLVFHALTRLLFPIGMFPLIMVLSALVFFPADWPRRLLARSRGRPRPALAPLPERSFVREVRVSRLQRALLAVGLCYCALQLALPLRFLAYGGNVLWHEQGMRFAWRVMLRAKGGSTTFIVRSERSGRVYYVSPRTYLTGLQESEMVSQPDLIVQLARHIRDDFAARGLGPVQVHADSRVSLNGRRGAPFIDPDVDLARVEDGLARASFVLPAPTGAPPHTRPVL